MDETGWVTEPGWRFTDTWFAHVCERNNPPIMAVLSYSEGIICPECDATLSVLEQLEMGGGLDAILQGDATTPTPSP